MDEHISEFNEFELGINNEIVSYLKETSSWTYFLSILGFVGVGFMVVVGIIISIVLGNSAMAEFKPYNELGFPQALLGAIYIVLGLLYFFPVVYLFNFSRKIKNALSNSAVADFTSAFKYLKSHYKFIGIFTIVVISMYVLMFLFLALGLMS